MTLLRAADGNLKVRDAGGKLTTATEVKMPAGIKTRVFVTEHILLPGESPPRLVVEWVGALCEPAHALGAGVCWRLKAPLAATAGLH